MTQFDPIFSALQKTGVRYVVVGGVAVNRPNEAMFPNERPVSRHSAEGPADAPLHTR